jgi:hypothetical protein
MVGRHGTRVHHLVPEVPPRSLCNWRVCSIRVGGAPMSRVYDAMHINVGRISKSYWRRLDDELPMQKCSNGKWGETLYR